MIFEIVVPNILYYRLSFSLPLILSQDFNQLTPFSKGLQRYTSFRICQIFADYFQKKDAHGFVCVFMVMEDNFRAL